MSSETFLERIRRLTLLENQHKAQHLSLDFIKKEITSLKIESFRFEKALDEKKPPVIIAEIKRRSPSRGELNTVHDPSLIAASYAAAGATAISVLTEPHCFGGRVSDLKQIRAQHPELLLLQKDFVIDPYQVYEAKFLGADAILLIVALLGKEKTRSLSSLAHSLGLSCLVEVHTRQELQVALDLGSKIIGVNNRDLHSLKVSLDVSRSLASDLKLERCFISESGISSAQEMKELTSLGYRGFLIGSSFMTSEDPACELKKLQERFHAS